MKVRGLYHPSSILRGREQSDHFSSLVVGYAWTLVSLFQSPGLALSSYSILSTTPYHMHTNNVLSFYPLLGLPISLYYSLYSYTSHLLPHHLITPIYIHRIRQGRAGECEPAPGAGKRVIYLKYSFSTKWLGLGWTQSSLLRSSGLALQCIPLSAPCLTPIILTATFLFYMIRS